MPIEIDIEMLELRPCDFTPNNFGGAYVRARLNKRAGTEWVKLFDETIQNLANARQVLLANVNTKVDAQGGQQVIAFDVSEGFEKIIHQKVKDAIQLTNASAFAKNTQVEDQRLSEEASKAASASNFQSIVNKLVGKT